MSDELPAGWGTAPKKQAPNAPQEKKRGGPLHMHPVGTLTKASPDMRAVAIEFARNDIRLELGFYQDTGNISHLWRAWRTARVFGDIPEDLMAMIAPQLDDAASPEKKNETRAEQKSERNYLLFNYYYLMDHERRRDPSKEPNKTDIYKRVAKAKKTTAGAVEQAVLKFEGRDGRRKS